VNVSAIADSTDKNYSTYNALKESKVYSTLFKHKLDNGGGLSSTSSSSITPNINVNRDNNKTSEVYVWGSNSSYQLGMGDTGLDRMMLPKLATSFSDVDSVRWESINKFM
jgi:alpha-tubulin suppressor-like RCC1 family protein